MEEFNSEAESELLFELSEKVKGIHPENGDGDCKRNGTAHGPPPHQHSNRPHLSISAHVGFTQLGFGSFFDLPLRDANSRNCVSSVLSPTSQTHSACAPMRWTA